MSQDNKLWGTYDFNQVSLVFGTRALEGFEEGTEITVERDEDSFTKKVDVDGNVTRSRSNNSSGKLKFTLSQFAPDNKYLTTIMNLDERTGAGVLPCKLVDKSNPSDEIVIAPEAWIIKPANRSFGVASGAREWTLDLASVNFANAITI